MNNNKSAKFFILFHGTINEAPANFNHKLEIPAEFSFFEIQKLAKEHLQRAFRSFDVPEIDVIKITEKGIAGFSDKYETVTYPSIKVDLKSAPTKDTIEYTRSVVVMQKCQPTQNKGTRIKAGYNQKTKYYPYDYSISFEDNLKFIYKKTLGITETVHLQITSHITANKTLCFVSQKQ